MVGSSQLLGSVSASFAYCPCSAHLGSGHRVVAAEDWYVRKSEESTLRVCKSVTARSFGSIQLTVCTCWEGTCYYCVNAPLRYNRTEFVPRYIPGAFNSTRSR